jgi:hypothetical protein
MAEVCIVGKKGSKAKLAIVRNTSLRLYKGGEADVIVNYGLAGDRLRSFLGRHAAARRIPVINKYIGISKYTAVQEADRAGILVPESRLSLPRLANLSKWIEKRVHSSQGNGICAARGRGRIPGKYYQEMIDDRRFELRVHAFTWLDKSEWALHKRRGPADQIAWNFHQGGYFQTVRYPNKYQVFSKAKDIAEQILKMRNMAFGAVDLIVDNHMKVYFIEVNASPGFTELSQDIYFSAMNRLADMSVAQVKKLGR